VVLVLRIKRESLKLFTGRTKKKRAFTWKVKREKGVGFTFVEVSILKQKNSLIGSLKLHFLPDKLFQLKVQVLFHQL